MSELATRLRERMYALYARYYQATSPALFHSDLDGKDMAVLMRDGAGCLRGFSSLAILRLPDARGCTVRAIFSGDTIVDHRYWGQQALAFTWLRLAGSIARSEPGIPLVWFLIVKGHRTYRYLQAFSRRYYPHWRDVTPAPEQALMHRLGAWRFGRHYDHRSGVVRYTHSHGQLCPALATIDGSARSRPEVAYFLARNPGYRNGDELVCLTSLDSDNLRPLARRLFEQGLNP